jgi:hypothetical protein
MTRDLRYPLVAREHEPEFDHHEFLKLNGAVRHVVGRCHHANVLPVVSLGELVAHLCIDCDTQLPDWYRA